MASVLHTNGEGFMRGATHEATSRYLSMALASRRLMKHLDFYAVTGEMSEPGMQALRNLLTIMDTTWQTGNSFAPIPGRSPFGHYEQAQIVSEVAEPFNSLDVRGKLGCIVKGSIKQMDRERAVHDINEFLYVLENRALHRYSETSSQREW